MIIQIVASLFQPGDTQVRENNPAIPLATPFSLFLEEDLKTLSCETNKEMYDWQILCSEKHGEQLPLQSSAHWG